MKFLSVLIVIVTIITVQARIFDLTDIDEETVNDLGQPEAPPEALVPTSAMYIPMHARRICKRGLCEIACRAIGFHHGKCVGKLCHCYD